LRRTPHLLRHGRHWMPLRCVLLLLRWWRVIVLVLLCLKLALCAAACQLGMSEQIRKKSRVATGNLVGMPSGTGLKECGLSVTCKNAWAWLVSLPDPPSACWCCVIGVVKGAER